MLLAGWVAVLLAGSLAAGCDAGGEDGGDGGDGRDAVVDGAAGGDGELDRAGGEADGAPVVGDGGADGPPIGADAGPAGPVEVEPCVETVRVGGLEVFAYEASRVDATGLDPGVDEAKPCSRAGVLPWTGISWPDASRVCLGAGFRLCSNEEWQMACQGELRLWHFPYGMSHQPARCNDHVSGSGMMEPTGTHAGCRTPEGAFDMSGNAWELTRDGARRGASWKINAVMFRVDAARCDMFYDVNEGLADDDLGFRCCR